MIIKATILVIASVAAFKVFLIRVRCSRNRSPSFKPPVQDGSSFKQFEEEEEENFTNYISDEEMEGEEEEEIKQIKCRRKEELKLNLPCTSDCRGIEFPIQEKKLNCVTELELLHNLVKELEQRKVNLEGKLLELYGMKEQQSYISQLQRTLEDKKAEINMLNITINSLQVERKQLQDEIKEVVLAEKQLETAKKMIVHMQKKIGSDGNWMKEQLVMLKEQVSSYQREDMFIRDTMIENELKVVKDVELEVIEMRRKNKELELEKRELKAKLVAAKARITAFSNMTESKIIAKVEEEISNLRHVNEELSKQVERLQKNRFGSVEELVYQRWLNSCLRFEVENHKTPSTKTSKDLGKKSGLDSHDKTKQLTLHPSFDSISSHTSSAKSHEFDSTIESSLSSHRSSSKKSGLIHKLIRWGRSKDDISVVSSSGSSSRGNSMSRSGLIRRFSTSMVPSNTSILRKEVDSVCNTTTSRKKKVQDSIESPKTPSFPRVRRVSFSDSVKTVQRVLDDKELLSPEMSGHSSSTMSASHCQPEFEVEKHEPLPAELALGKAGNSSDSRGKSTTNDRVDTQVAGRTEIMQTEELHPRMPNVIPNEDNIGTHSTAHFIVTFFLFLFMLLVYLSLAGIY